MEDELSFLRQKVNRLEDMIYNINDKIGLVLEKLLTHRTSQVNEIRRILQEEEDVCVSLAAQLKSCINSDPKEKTTPASCRSPRQVHVSPTVPASVSNQGTGQARITRSSSVKKVASVPSSGASTSKRPVAPPQVAVATTPYQVLDLNKNYNAVRTGTGSRATGREQDPLSTEAASHSHSSSSAMQPGERVIILKTEGNNHDFHSEEMDTNNQQLHLHPANLDTNDTAEDENEHGTIVIVTAAGKKRKRGPEDFEVVRSFPNEIIAREQMRLDRCWRLNTSAVRASGKKWYYDCKFGGRRSRGGNCPMTSYLLVMEDRVDQYCSIGEHNHADEDYAGADTDTGQFVIIN